MVWTIKQVVAQMEVSEREVSGWIEQRWVLPLEEDGELLFDEVDCARIRLIVELRRDLEVNDEAIPVVLRLLDQVYGLRRTLDELRQGIMGLSEGARSELEASLAQIRKTH
ncbi:MAG: chaperone modulator CbpM [Kiloniellales bacterium]|jgi:chaperone modulatory protein CbpM|nr:chaperone modulator CbpM [Kiloniellales bacterium]